MSLLYFYPTPYFWFLVLQANRDILSQQNDEIKCGAFSDARHKLKEGGTLHFIITMSDKPKKTITKSAAAKADELVQFSKAVDALSKAMAKQHELHESLADFAPERLQEWQAKLDAAKRAHEGASDEMEQDAKRRRVDHVLDVKAGGLEVASALLTEEGYTAIRTIDLEELKERVFATEQRLVTIQGDTEDRVEKELNKDHKTEMEKQILIHAAEFAKLKEQNELLKGQLSDKPDTIAGLRDDVKSTQAMVSQFATQPKYEVHSSSRGDK